MEPKSIFKPIETLPVGGWEDGLVRFQKSDRSSFLHGYQGHIEVKMC